MAMALSVKQIMKSDYAIATTGNAGPSKGDSNAQVGLVLSLTQMILVKNLIFGQPRRESDR
jgi:nicotinamide-nucleotide amidase